jgi:hypothetical protein
MELGNLIEDAKGKCSKRKNARQKVLMLRSGTDHFVVVMKLL